METDYEERLRATNEQIYAHNSIRVEKDDRGGLAYYLGDADNALKLINRVDGAPLPSELAHNFHRHSGILLAWRAVSPYETVAGEFRLVHIAEALLSGTPPWLTDFAGRERELELLGRLRVFDTQPNGGTGTFAALRLTGDTNPPEVWYFEMTQGAMRLDLSYGDYLNALLCTRGLYYWQYLFAEPAQANPGLSGVLPTLRSGLNFLVHAFPGEDFSDLTARLEERERRTGE